MKKTAVKRLSAVLLAIIVMFTFAVNAFAETVQDRIERQLQELLEKYQSADPESQESIQERFNRFLEENGLEDIDLGSLQDTDIANIIANLGDNLAFDQFFGLAQNAWSSGMAMIQDAFGGGNGTSDGKNTAKPSTPQYTSPNVIEPANTTAANTPAVGIPSTTVIPPVSSEQIPNITTVPNIIGAGITTATPTTNATIIDDSEMNSSSVIVLSVLSVSTVAVIIAIVMFFVLKRR